MTTAPPIDELREKAEANALRLQIWQQDAALKAIKVSQISEVMESYYDPSNYVNPNDYLGEGRRRSNSSLYIAPTSRNDRQDGKNLPLFQTEQELATMRGSARLLASCHPRVIGILANLANYIIRQGFDHKVSSESDPDWQVVPRAQNVLDRFKKRNDWPILSRELFVRSRRDGEYFLGLWATDAGNVDARVIEPDQVTQPGNQPGIEEWLGCSNPSSWSFGVHSAADDVVDVHGYYVQWTNNPTDWDYMPGGRSPIVPPGSGRTWCEHVKVNVDSNVKRGMSDLFSVEAMAELSRKLLRNTGEGGALQAAIAWIREVATPDRANLEAQISARADLTGVVRTASGGTRNTYTTQYEPGTILTPSPGTQYKPGPMGSQNAPNYIAIDEALCRVLAVRWNMPEHMVSGSAHNNNFASILVSGDPFVMAGEVEQMLYAGAEERIMWKVLFFAWLAGEFDGTPWEEIASKLKIDVTGAEIAVRDPKIETDRRAVLKSHGLLSDKTWSTLEGLDYDQEKTNIEEQGGTVAPSTASSPGAPPVAAAAAPETPVASAPASPVTDAGVQTDKTINGAQVESALSMLVSVRTGEIAPAAALELIVGLGLERTQAETIVNAQKALPPLPLPPPAPEPVATPAPITESAKEPADRTLSRRILDTLLWRNYP